MSTPNLVQAIFYNNPDLYPPIINGVRRLADAGWNTELLCRENGENWNIKYPDGVVVRRINKRSASSWREYIGFVSQVLRQATGRPAVYIGHDMHGFLPARLLATIYRRPVIYHCHDFAGSGDPVPRGSRIVRVFERCFARTADLVIVPDAERGRLIARELRLPKAPLIVANAPLLAPIDSGVELQRVLAAGGFRFDSVVLRQGRIGPGHAIETTLRSIQSWSSRSWGLVLIGIGSPEYIDRLRNIANDLGIGHQFALLDPVGYDKVARFTPGAHLGIAMYDPIHTNNQFITTASNKLMEYMAAGLPVLVSDTPSMRSFVAQYHCGITADERSPTSIAAAVNGLLNDPTQAARLGTAGRQAFENQFCYERQFAAVLAELESLTQVRGKTSVT